MSSPSAKELFTEFILFPCRSICSSAWPCIAATALAEKPHLFADLTSLTLDRLLAVDILLFNLFWATVKYILEIAY
jgi:hypothetical protein